ncbi:MAG: baseplate J/gp47 family protein, partial [Chloroflexota bacterium]|nr:baseplate J/gp47 family protein [Chloroflexota bacterium]
LADVQQNDLDAAAGHIPARVLTTELDGERTVVATGTRDAPDAPAKGFVKFSNAGAEAVAVPKGTVTKAGTLLFATTEDAQVPAATKAGDATVNGTATAPVQAVNPGKEGNVHAGAITALDGPLSGKLTVINMEKLVGGSVKPVSYLSGDDEGAAKEALRSQLVQRAMDQIHAQVARNLTFVPNPDNQGDGAIEQLTFEQTPEQVTSQTVLHMRVLVKGLTFEGDDVNSVVDQAMRAAARRNGSQLQLTGDPLKIDPPVILADNGSTIKLRVHALERAVRPLDSARIIDAVRGMSRDQAHDYLKALPGLANADVELWPDWVGHLPRFGWRIGIRQLSPLVPPGP